MNFDVWSQTIELIPWSLIVQFSAVAILGLIAKRFYDNLASYFMFRSNKDLGKNVQVIVNGQAGFIAYFTLRFIYVRLETGNELVIPITRWTTYKWEICKK